ncbi:MAG: DUF3380 domain-containing protein [Hymenobacter sp.]|nr:MAG: DUF3380 domain-containing protein [Hymenobacter sp.]
MSATIIPLIPPGKKLTLNQIILLCKKYGYDLNVIRAFMAVESGGTGFSSFTGRMIIQFEPAWFKKNYADWKKDTTGTVWLNNGIGNQVQEYAAFNDAYKRDPEAAMLSTSIGIGQVMGFHHLLLGFATVGAMWTFARESEANQLELILRFIKASPKLEQAVKAKNWTLIATYYNGAGFLALAKKYKFTPYDKQMETQYLKYAA